MLALSALASALPELALGLAVGGHTVAQAGLLMHASHRYRFLRGGRVPAPQRPADPSEWPRVTVQLPVYNEPAVVERLIDAVAALDYPRDRLHIQLLDDSDDAADGLGTSARAASAVARHRAQGIDIDHVRRGSRAGYKAGALAHGMQGSEASMFAILDADFVPAPDFLRRLVPYFADPRVGLVQARWGHLDRDASWLTRAQATLLDAHFLLEHTVRQQRGRFFNFNGTGGVWRRECIEQAGGWSHATLTEDLDLSYRAQAAGWRFVFDPTVVVPAELPGDLRAFQGQQRRWVTGAIQTAILLLPRLWQQPLPLAVRVEATLHLTANTAYPLLLLAMVLLPSALAAPRVLAPPAELALQVAMLMLGIVPVSLFLIAGQRAAGRPWRRALTDAGLALLLGTIAAPSNAYAVWRGATTRGGVFERTPKRGDTSPRAARSSATACP